MNLSRSTLIYVSSQNNVEVFKTDGTLIQTLSGFGQTHGLCSDPNGNVWVTETNYGGSQYGELVEYAHGGTSPIAIVSEMYAPWACAVDPSTGNLAAANGVYFDSVAIFKHGRGSPKYYHSYSYPSGFESFFSAAYDNHRDLFVAGFIRVHQPATGWLPPGASGIGLFALRPKIFPHRGLYWDGRYLVIGNATDLVQYKIKNGKGVKVGSIHLDTVFGTFTIHDALLVVSDAGYYRVQLFKYPQGGEPIRTIPNIPEAQGVAISPP